MGYSIKVLSNEEFEKLPYRHTDIALGLADPKQNTAYVRYSAYPELNKYLIDHEFEHLLEEHGTDEIDGVRYKIPLLGPLVSGLGSLASKALPAIGGALGGAVSKAPSFLGNIGSSALNLGKSAIGGISNVGQGLFGGLQKAGSGIMSMFGSGGGGSVPRQAGISGVGGQYSPYTGTPTGGTQFGQSQGQRQGFGGIFDMFKDPRTLLGGGLTLAGLLKGTPKVPNVSGLPSVQEFRNIQTPGQSPLGQQSQSVISSNLMKQFNPLTAEETTAATADLDRSRLASIKRLEGLYASARPGTDYTTDTQYKQDLSNIDREYSEAKANLIANRTREAESFFNENQLRNLALAKDWSTEEAQFVYQFRNELAQMDVDQIMLQYQVNYQKALDWKQTAIQLGSELLLSGIGGS